MPRTESTGPVHVSRGWFDAAGSWPWVLPLFGLAHFGAMLLGNASYFEPGTVATFWPGSGLLLGALVVCRLGRWPAVVLVSMAAQSAADVLVYDRALANSALFGLTNALEGLVGAAILRWLFGRRISLQRVEEVLALVLLAALLSPALAALCGAAILSGGFGAEGYWQAWRLWSLADGLGVVLIAPLILLFTVDTVDRWSALRGRGRLELIAVVAALPALQLAFGGGAVAGGAIVATVLPILVWTALRFGGFVAVVCTLLNGLAVIVNHDLGKGPFVAPASLSIFETALMVQIVLATQAITVLVLSAVLASRSRIDTARRTSDVRYRALFESSTDGVLVTRGPRFVDCNEAILEALGYTREELLGMTPWEISPPLQPDGSDSRRRAETIIAAASEGQAPPFEWRHLRRDGSPIDFEIGIAGSTGVEGDLMVIAHLRDITERKRAERELNERLRFETLISEISASFVNLPPEHVDAEIREALRRIVEELDLDRASIFEQRGERVARSHFWAREGIPDTPETVGEYPYLARAMLAGEPLIVPDVDRLPAEAAVDRKSFARYGQRALVAFPVKVGGAILAAVTFGSFRRSPEFSSDLLSRLRLMAEVLANALARKRAEEGLRESEERFRAVFESSPTGLTIRRLDDLALVAANPAVAKMLGYSVEEYLRLSPEEIVPGGSGLYLRMAEMLGRGDPYEFTAVAARHREGHDIQIEGSFIPLSYRGEPHVLGLSHDVTDQKRAEEALRLSEEKFAMAFEASPDGLIITSLADGRIVEINSGFTELSGYSREEALGRTTLELELWEDVADRERILREVVQSTGPSRVRVRLRLKSGEVRTGELSFVHMEVAGETRLLCVVRDVTEQEADREALQRSEEKFFKAFHSGPGASAITSLRDNRLLDVNDNWVRLTGWKRHEAVGKTSAELGIQVDPGVRDKLLETASRLQDDMQPMKVETRSVVRDGRELMVELSAAFIDVGGEPCLLSVANDLTERRRAEAAREAAYREIARLRDELQQERDYLREEVKVARRFGAIVGESAALREMLEQLEAVAATDASVLIRGESGVGKELVATAIHSRSSRSDRPLVRVNCASVPRELFESEFFGHVKGAFTGAHRDRVGRFQLAHGGTLFLDEIAEIPIELQPKLLRALQEGEIERIGEERTRKVDVRVIAATNRDLEEEIRSHRFREDLYYRISVFPLDVPALRDRGDDVVLLARHFIDEFCRQLGRTPPALSRFQAEQLRRHAWPGNIRELRNVIEKALILSSGDRLPLEIASLEPRDSADAAAPASPNGPAFVSYAELERRERDNLLAALTAADWKVSGPGGAAELLGLKPTTLASKIKALGLRKPS